MAFTQSMNRLSPKERIIRTFSVAIFKKIPTLFKSQNVSKTLHLAYEMKTPVLPTVNRPADGIGHHPFIVQPRLNGPRRLLRCPLKSALITVQPRLNAKARFFTLLQENDIPRIVNRTPNAIRASIKHY